MNRQIEVFDRVRRKTDTYINGVLQVGTVEEVVTGVTFNGTQTVITVLWDEECQIGDNVYEDIDASQLRLMTDDDYKLANLVPGHPRGVGQPVPPNIPAFVREMKAADIHVGLGDPPICVACDQPFPCSEGKPGNKHKRHRRG